MGMVKEIRTIFGLKDIEALRFQCTSETCKADTPAKKT